MCVVLATSVCQGLHPGAHAHPPPGFFLFGLLFLQHLTLIWVWLAKLSWARLFTLFVFLSIFCFCYLFSDAERVLEKPFQLDSSCLLFLDAAPN